MYRLRWYCCAILNGGRFGDLRTIYQGCRALSFALAGLSCCTISLKHYIRYIETRRHIDHFTYSNRLRLSNAYTDRGFTIYTHINPDMYRLISYFCFKNFIEKLKRRTVSITCVDRFRARRRLCLLPARQSSDDLKDRRPFSATDRAQLTTNASHDYVRQTRNCVHGLYSQQQKARPPNLHASVYSLTAAHPRPGQPTRVHMACYHGSCMLWLDWCMLGCSLAGTYIYMLYAPSRPWTTYRSLFSSPKCDRIVRHWPDMKW